MNIKRNEFRQFHADHRSSAHSILSSIPFPLSTSSTFILYPPARSKPILLSFPLSPPQLIKFSSIRAHYSKVHPSNHLLIHNQLSSPKPHSITTAITIQSSPTVQPSRKTQPSILINSNPIRHSPLTMSPHSINTLHSPTNTQSRMHQPLSPEIDELREYKFIQFIRKRKRRRVMKRFLEGYCLFVPINISLTNRVTSKDIRQIVNLLLTL